MSCWNYPLISRLGGTQTIPERQVINKIMGQALSTEARAESGKRWLWMTGFHCSTFQKCFSSSRLPGSVGSVLSHSSVVLAGFWPWWFGCGLRDG